MVAIHSVSEEGIRFSPKPGAPLIGSNTLPVLTTPWDNLDLSSLAAYRETERLYGERDQTKNQDLELGAHFDSLASAAAEVRDAFPSIFLHYVHGTRRSFRPSRSSETTSDYSRVASWSIRGTTKDRAIENWTRVKHRLATVSYRRDVILYLNKLDRAIRGIRNLTEQSSAFNITVARDLNDLYTTR